ncbi:hypothetical protein [Nocardioides sp. GY 10127]|uniref:hypothetical protein n=1 Tax=Nocardioides sp. GY 10127 TaxID=2569762 RepID=UPI0010A91C09|nr:hypothetical protein [Nocardioides sp. GY 10127]TIC78801.1 hypothetical protein E8D37_19080 [Nocardioides sp. GY 10127]
MTTTTQLDMPDPAGRAELQQHIEDARDSLRRARTALLTAVAAGRRGGLTWAQIGSALGTTRQSAWERFSHHIEAHP